MGDPLGGQSTSAADLQTANVQQVSRQHVVSKVLLKQFTAPGPRSSGNQLVAFDLKYPERHHKLKTPRQCGWVRDFISFDPDSAEDLWRQIEQRVPEVFSALNAGAYFDDPRLVEVLRDLIAVHMVRSHWYLEVHQQSYKRAYDRLRVGLLRDHSERVRAEALRETGLHLTTPGALAAYVDRVMEGSVPAREYVSGKMFRISIEDMFNKIREAIGDWGLEIVRPQQGEFLIGDTPAMTLRRESDTWTYGVALGDASTVVLPLGPKCLVALGADNASASIPLQSVYEINVVQVLAAQRHVFFRPGSGLNDFVKIGCRYRDSTVS
ncbi:DUF4238 domain-containing protein [Streptomyces sp. NPDC051940]|uniref:DUF4238 domain-containing protein n=1 Tax=Streptomyces sp. NPDC051940 TaxID=3155675 RepID=UPI00341B632F